MQPPAPRGRGSHLEPANRFTLRTVERDLDGLDADDLAALARRPTRYVVDHAVGIVSENDSPDVPFRFSLNPYRGCLHGCAYCLVGETPILMADGTTRPLADLRVGEAIYGTVLKGRYRYFTRTPVLAHWQTVKPAYRIRLADGTELVASPDHRFLTQRGWKYVAPAEVGQRPYLTLNDWLLGIGGFTSDSARTADDQPGYLTDLRIVSIDSLGIQLPMYDITTGTGDFIANGIVSHNCYARPSHEYLGLNAGLDFETIIFVKERAPALFRDWLARPAWVPEPITLSGVTDPYQPAERDYRLTRGCLEVALEALQPVSLITKNALLTRDLDLLAPLASQNLVHATVSVTTLDDELARSMEPRASTPAARGYGARPGRPDHSRPERRRGPRPPGGREGGRRGCRRVRAAAPAGCRRGGVSRVAGPPSAQLARAGRGPHPGDARRQAQRPALRPAHVRRGRDGRADRPPVQALRSPPEPGWAPAGLRHQPLPPAPALLGAGVAVLMRRAPPGYVTFTVAVPVMELFAESVTVTVCAPPRLSLTLKTCWPLSAAVKV